MICIVTGASRGIGAATAQLFAEQAYDVLLTSRNPAELQATCEEIRRKVPKRRVEAFPCDVSDASQVDELFAFCQSKLGTPSVLINNAAVIKVAAFDQLPLADWDYIQAVNVRGVMLCSRQAFALMKAEGGSIINISSLGGVRGTQKFPGFVAYSTSKAAIIGFTEALAAEGKPFGIRVNCVAPGAVETQMLAAVAPNLRTQVMPSDLAKTIYVLADKHLSSHVSGSTLEVYSND